MRAGIIAGSVSAIVAAIVSVPLYSPDDIFFNSATVVIGALLAGLSAGIVWRFLAGRPRGPLMFAIVWVVAIAFTAVFALAGETQLDHFVAFVLPLGAIVFLLTGLLTTLLHRITIPAGWWSVIGIVVIALAVGAGLAGQGDERSGRLELPPRAAGSPSPQALQTIAPAAGAALPLTTPTTAPTSAAPPLATETKATLAATATLAPMELRKTGEITDITFLVGEGSEATFTVQEQLSRLPLPNDAVVRTSAISGEIYLDGRPSNIQIDLHQLSSDQSRRDQYVRERMFPNDPIASFAVTDLGQLPEGFTEGESVTGAVTGLLTLRGITVPISFALEGRDDGDVFLVLGRTSFVWSDFGMQAPNIAGVVEVTDEVTVEILLAARPFIQLGS